MSRLIEITSGIFAPICTALSMLVVSGCDTGNPPGNTNFDTAAAAAHWSREGSTWNDAELRVLENGRLLYQRNCAGCHLLSGQGQATLGAPPLKGSAVVKGPVTAHIDIALQGRNVMPPFADVLNDEQLAAILSYQRNAWGNNTGEIVNAAQVQAQRSGSPLQ
jgi:mono/diheme cytochrome c family protein